MSAPAATPEAAGGPFSRTVIWILVGVAAASLIATLVLTAFADDLQERPSAGADGYSVSALGHHALIELLEELDVPVLVSRHGSADKAKNGLLIVAEPVVTEDDPRSAEALKEAMGEWGPVLLVLPKRYGIVDAESSRWISDDGMLSVEDAEMVLHAAGVEGSISRSDRAAWVDDSRWSLPAPSLHLPQTMSGEDVDVLVRDDDGNALLAATYKDGRSLYILTDPDLLATHGLHEGENARFAVALIDALREDGPVVFDETVHGFKGQASMWKAFLQFPLVLATLQTIVCALLLLWAAVGRFGAARPAPPALASGKDFLIHNTAALLRFGGHDGHALRRYLTTTIQAVRHTLHAPLDLDAAGGAAWLERVRLARGGTISLVDLEREVTAAATTKTRGQARHLVELAIRIHRWRTEMTHGPQRH